jgi:hypothetical protein
MPGSVDLLLAHRRRFIQAMQFRYSSAKFTRPKTLVGVARDMRREMEYTDDSGDKFASALAGVRH